MDEGEDLETIVESSLESEALETCSNMSETIPRIENEPITIGSFERNNDFYLCEYKATDSDSPVLLTSRPSKTYSRYQGHSNTEDAQDLTFTEFEMLSDNVYSKPEETRTKDHQDIVEMALKNKILKLQSRVFQLKSINTKLEIKLKDLKQPNFEINTLIDTLEYVSDEAKDFCKMLLSPKNVYSENQKILACNIHFKSTSNYKFMRDQLGFHIPCTRSIYNYFPIKQLQPGFNFKLRTNLSLLSKKMSEKERQAVLIFDEVTTHKIKWL